MMTHLLFSTLFDKIAEDLRIPSPQLELIEIRTDFNTRTAEKTFVVTVQLPNGKQMVRRIEEISNVQYSNLSK